MSGSITASIPASAIVDVNGQPISGGGNALSLSGLMLSKANRIPQGLVMAFPSPASIGAYFGLTSPEYFNALVYFNGYSISTAKPATMLVASYPLTAVGAFMRGGYIAGLTLTQLQAISGVLTVSLNGTPETSSSINLSAATSFSNAAQLITNALGVVGPTQASITASIGASFTGVGSGTNLTASAVTGVIHAGDAITGTGITPVITIVSQTSGSVGGAGVYVTSGSTTASGTIVATSTVLDVTAISSGTIQVGAEVTGDSMASGTYINSYGSTVGGVATTGTGGTGTYSVTVAGQEASGTVTMVMPTVTYDSLAGAFTVVSSTTGPASTISFGTGTISSGLMLTSATGAMLSQGAAIAVPGVFMPGVVNVTTNWATFWSCFDPDSGSGNTQKQLFAAWVNGTNNRYVYIVDDMDITPTESTQATSSLGYILLQNKSSGTIINYEDSVQYLAAFVSGSIASINYSALNGRITLAFKSQSGLNATVTNQLVASNLIANGYNFYGNYSTPATNFLNYYPGSITGAYSWADSYVNQIQLTNALQLSLFQLLTLTNSIPYNPPGRALMTAACQVPIQQALNFGSIAVGVTPSAEEAAIAISQSGVQSIAGYLQNQGYYLQILPATSQVRGARTSPPCNLWYMDGESVQQITLTAYDIQ